ncbi:MAG: hypothetical protein EOP51_01690 [Sphingobacteriales bacterium]|nr:MAG: hypothetical protein EOP51_01690 [Sphingobacteriales bacterium]
MKRNVAALGMFLGVVMPLIGVMIMFLVKFQSEGIRNYITAIFNNGKFGFMVLSLSLLLNLIPFLYFTNKRLDQSARGVLIATMLYAVLMVLLRYVW